MLNKDFQYIVDKQLGVPRDARPLTAEQIVYARDHLPSSYVDFLVDFGLGNYFKRGIQFCDPQEFRPLMALIFKTDSEFSHKDCHLVSYSAFGKLEIWSERYWLVDVDMLKYHVSSSKLFPTELANTLLLPTKPKREATANSVASGLMPLDEDDRECWDQQQRPMFTRCVQQHGALRDGECFGFVPSLGMVGYESKYRSVEHIKRVKALEHFCLIAQLQPFKLTRLTSRGYEYQREIG